MLKSIRILGMVLVLASMVVAQTASDAGMRDSEKAIRTELETQVAAWNRGDLKGYMQGSR